MKLSVGLGSGFSRSLLRPKIGIALLGLLAVGASLPAQAGQGPLPSHAAGRAGVQVDNAGALSGDPAFACGATAEDARVLSPNDAGPGMPSAFSAARILPCPYTVLRAAAASSGPASLSQPNDADSDAPAPNGPVEPGHKIQPARAAEPGDFNRGIYYKNRLEFSLDTGCLLIDIPFVFDFLMGDNYNQTPLNYTLVPIIASFRWQMDDVAGPSFLRGNWESSFSGAFTVIPRGPETRYISYIMGIRRNFVHPNWRIAPYLEGRVGIGNIDAKEPQGVLYAQGQDLTFTLLLDSGLRYNLNSRYAFLTGLEYMHISNLYLSEPKYPNYGINVWGPMIGLQIRLGKPRHAAE